MGKRGPKPKHKPIKWNAKLAYATGLMVTDGNLSSDKRHLSFISKDKEQVENLRKCLDLTVGLKKVSSKARGSLYYRVQWGDVQLYNFFLSIGLTPNKSRTIEKVDIPNKLFEDFLRGCFDGDGSFYSYYDSRWKSSFMYYVSFVSASKHHILWLQKTLLRLYKVKGHVILTGASGVCSLRYAKKESLIVIRKMYSGKKKPHLKRKRLKIRRALGIVKIPL
jgi:hypothetical protein